MKYESEEEGISFRVAYRVVAKAVRMVVEERRDTITEEIINQAGEQVLGQPIGLEKEKLSVSVGQILKARKSAGAGSPSDVQKMVKNEEKSLAKEDTWVAEETNRIEACKVNVDSIIRNYEEQRG